MSRRKITLTVGRVRKVLSELPANLEVWTEGCDCNGEASGIQIVEGRIDTPHVLIERK